MQCPLFGYGKNADCGIFLRPLFILLRIAMLRVRNFAEGGFFMHFYAKEDVNASNKKPLYLS